MNPDKPPDSRPYKETLEAAKIFQEIARPAPRPRADTQPKPGDAASGASAAPAAPTQAAPKPGPPSPEAAKEAREPSIGELFSKLVKMSPPEKMRLEKDSVGSLFRKYITKRG